MAHEVFISHSSKDKAIADKLCAALEQSDIRCWIAPRDVMTGKNYAEAILDGIESSRFFVLILSDSANDSPHVLREVERAVNRDITVVTFRVGAFRLSRALEYLISAHQWLDATSPPTRDQVRVLVETVSALLKGRLVNAVLESEKPEDRLHDLPNSTTSQTNIGLNSRTIGEDPSLLVETRIGSYLLQRLVGGGGMGFVYTAWDTRLARTVCVKLSYPLQSESKMMMKIASRSVRALSAMDHPNLIKVWDFGPLNYTDDQSFYIVMDHVKGITLDRWSETLPSGTTSSALRLLVAYELARALHVAHNCSYLGSSGFEERGLLHGGIRPANILVRADNAPVILDFMMVDIQKLLNPEVVRHFATGLRKPTEACGTKGFMSPEQEEQGIVTVRSDVFSLGVTLSSLLERELALTDTQQRWRPLMQFIDEMRATDPNKRPPNMMDVAARICGVAAAAGIRLRGLEREPVPVAPWQASRAFTWGFLRRGRKAALGFLCPSCLAWIPVKDETLGTTVRCRHCRKSISLTTFAVEADVQPFLKKHQDDTD